MFRTAILAFASLLSGAQEIEPYLQTERHKAAVAKLDHEDSGLLQGVVAVENQHQDDVVVYHALPFYLYMLMWIWNGVVDDKALEWMVYDLKTPYPVAKSPLLMRVFEGTDRFPFFAAPDDRVCKQEVTFGDFVRDSKGRVGRIMEGGGNRVGVTFENGEEQDFVLQANGCFDLIYTRKEAQAKYPRALSEAQLAEHHIENATSFEGYCDEVGVWKDQHNTPDHIAGVRERLLSLNLNVFGSWKAGWADSSWDIFRQGVSLSPHGRGGRVPLMEDIFQMLNASEETVSTVRNQLDFMNCIIGKRTLRDIGNCESKFSESEWSCESEDQLNQLKDSNGPKSEDCHKVILNTMDNLKCGTDVLLQLIMPTAMADDLVYLSLAGGRPGWDNSTQIFSEAYDELKNREAGDLKQGRMLLRRDAFLDGSGLNFASHSALFLDAPLMASLTSMAEDVRRTLLGKLEACRRDDTTAAPAAGSTAPAAEPGPTKAPAEPAKTPVKFEVGIFRIIAILLLVGAAVLSIYYRMRTQPAQPDPRMIEMPGRV